MIGSKCHRIRANIRLDLKTAMVMVRHLLKKRHMKASLEL